MARRCVQRDRLAVSGGRGTEFHAPRQAHGKIGECALAQAAGLNPLMVINWKHRADNGTDIRLLNGWLVDVKTTLPNRRLIWSVSVNHLFWCKSFTHLVSCTVEEDHHSRCWIEGYISKEEFFERKREFDGSDGLDPFTWYMLKSELYDIHDALPGWLGR